MGSGNSSGIIIDITGEANLNFHGIPLNAIKKASFLSKANTVAAILKMTVNNVTYDFQKTAQNGAVVFGGNYGRWDFIAPNGRFNFSSYANSTVGQTLQDMESVLTVSPVPAWDTFIRWVRAQLDNLQINTNGISSCFVTPIGHTGNRVQANVISLDNLTDCVSFIKHWNTPLNRWRTIPLPPISHPTLLLVSRLYAGQLTAKQARNRMCLACLFSLSNDSNSVCIEICWLSGTRHTGSAGRIYGKCREGRLHHLCRKHKPFIQVA